jgi:pyruvate dehydrogenase complex dehydrogenase (E1) component
MSKKRHPYLEALKQRVVDPNYEKETLKILQHGVKQIYNHNADGVSYSDLYGFVHNNNHLPQFFFSS